MIQSWSACGITPRSLLFKSGSGLQQGNPANCQEETGLIPTGQMTMYFNVWQLPEVSQFPKGERHRIYRKYIHPLLTRWPVMLGSFVFNFLIILSLIWLPGVLKAYVIWIPCYLVADHFFKVVAIILQRPRLKKMMEEVPLERPPGSDLATAH